MARTGRPGLSSEQKRELWTRWKDGQSLGDIGRALGKHAASVFGVVAAKGDIAPPARTRSQASLTMEEREDISRGLVAGLIAPDRRRAWPRALDGQPGGQP